MENKLPEGWEWKKLGEIAEINPKFDRKSISENIEVTFLPMRCIEELTGNVDTSITKNLEEVSKGYTPLMENDLIYAKITPCMENGKVAIAKGLKNNLGFASTEFHVIRFKKNAYNKFFFFYLIQKWIREYAAMNMTGSAGQKRVPATFLKDLLVPLPPLETQQKIVSILEKAEETKKLRAQADELTQKLLQSVFLEMFGDPVKNPRKWDERSLESLLDEDPQNGLYKPSTDYGEGTQILRIDSFYDGKISNIKKLKRLNCTPEEIKKYGLNIGEVLINRVNSLEYLGKCGLVETLFEPTVFESNIMRLKLKKSTVNPEYLTSFLCTQFIKNQILQKAKKAVNQASINQADVKSLKILLPPIQLQNNYSFIIKQIERTKQSQKQSSLEINNLFDALMQKAFTGELIA
jgi:type I restriction enzyme S subunit